VKRKMLRFVWVKTVWMMFGLFWGLSMPPVVVEAFVPSTTTTLVSGGGGGSRLPRPRRLSTSSSSSSLVVRVSAAPRPTDGPILVVGGTGGVGQLVTQRLLQAGYTVRVASRNPERARTTLSLVGHQEEDNGNDNSNNQQKDKLEVVQLDLVPETTSVLDQQLSVALQGVAGVVISVGTTAFPTLKWRGGNTPQAIDADAVTRIVQAATTTTTKMKRIVLVTSVGVERTNEMPFTILNLFGVLDAKRTGEHALRKACADSQPNKVDFVIVRPGRLVGGPFTNYDVARLLQLQGGAENGVDVAIGDSLLGDCKRDACAAAIVEAVRQPAATNIIFSLVSNTEKEALTDEQWNSVFASLSSSL
jgi:nucleoside-diphosphate-sugar epimerase